MHVQSCCFFLLIISIVFLKFSLPSPSLFRKVWNLKIAHLLELKNSIEDHGIIFKINYYYYYYYDTSSIIFFSYAVMAIGI